MQGAGSSSKAMALSLIGAAKNSRTRVERDPGTVPVESSIRSLTNLLRCRFGSTHCYPTITASSFFLPTFVPVEFFDPNLNFAGRFYPRH